MLLALTHMLHLCLRVMSPVVIFYLLSFNPFPLVPTFSFLNYKASPSFYFYSFTRSFNSLSDIESADVPEERLRCVAAGLIPIPGYKLTMQDLIPFDLKIESRFRKDKSILYADAAIPLWLFALY
jgi:hypothetical protein